MGDAPGQVFISYSHDSEEHSDRVLALADELRGKGINAWIDQYEESPPQGWPDWCDEQITKAKYVLMICTKTYRQRFNRKGPASVGLGVAWEASALKQAMYAAKAVNKKVIPIVLDGSTAKDVPNRLRDSTVYSLPTDTEKLYRRLSGQKKTTPPPLGPVVPMQRRSKDAQSAAAKGLPGLGVFIGRANETETVVQALLHREPVLLLGPGGIGKSTITISALRDPQIIARYGTRRFFINLAAATKVDAVVSEIATVLGIMAPANPRLGVLEELRGAPAVVVLDNLETPWDEDGERAGVEELLAQLAASGAAIAVSIRGTKRPSGVNWCHPLEIEPFTEDDSRKLFFAEAGNQFKADLHLDRLLKELDGLPLAINLVARSAQGNTDLEPLWNRWLAERQLPVHGKDKRLSASVSFELSIKSPRMNDSARSLLRILSLLPAGIARDHLELLMSNEVWAARETLQSVGLAYEDAGKRLQLLSPLRAHVVANHPATHQEAENVESLYLRLSRELGARIGWEGGGTAATLLAHEFENCAAAIERGLTTTAWDVAIEAARTLANCVRLTGLGSKKVVEAAIVVARSKGRVDFEAECVESLGDIALARSDLDDARVSYEEALLLWRKVDDVRGEANCTFSLGVISLQQLDDSAARAKCEAALLLYRKVDDVLGEANCSRRLGDIALNQSDSVAAGVKYEEALPLYRRVGDIMGEANCFHCLGLIALRKSAHAVAQAKIEEGLTLYRRAGAVRGEANCIQGLGDIAFDQANYVEARAKFEEALPFYRKIGDVHGEANCSHSLGEIAQRQNDQETARAEYEKALSLFEKIREPYSVGRTCRALARTARDPEERAKWVRRALESWRPLGRPHLMQALEHEFSGVFR